jgi:uncharacterized protein (DUF2147 family)
VRYRFSVLVAVSLGAAGPAWGQDATGEWLVKDKTAQIRIVNCGGSLWGVVSWEQAPGGRDTKNPDQSKRDRPTLGMPILLDMKPDDPGKWEGEIYNAENGRTYDGSIVLRDPATLRVEGCVMGFLCGGEDWSRAQPRSGPAGSARAPGSDPSTAPPATICASIGAGRPH